jgi:hypothetical protein
MLKSFVFIVTHHGETLRDVFEIIILMTGKKNQMVCIGCVMHVTKKQTRWKNERKDFMPFIKIFSHARSVSLLA